MQFLMLMIPKVYRGNKVDPGFVPDPEKLAEMAPLQRGAGQGGHDPLVEWPSSAQHRRAGFVRKGKADGDRWAVHRDDRSAGRFWMVEASSKEELVKWAQRCPADEGDVIEIRQIFDEADFAIKK